MKIRASDAPLADKCPASMHGEGDAVIIHRVDEYGTVGTAVHATKDLIVAGREVDTGALAAQYALAPADKREFLRMVGAVFAWWSKVSHLFPNAQTEREFASGELTGHTDITGQAPPIARVADIKTTRREDADYTPQGMIYLHLVSNDPGFAECERFQFIQVFVRDWTQNASSFYTRAELNEWVARFLERIANWDGKTYNRGGHCWYCGRCAVCPGIREEMRNTGSMALYYDEKGLAEALAEITPAQQVRLWERAGICRKFLDNIRDGLKLLALGAGGKLVGDGQDLVLTEQVRQGIKPGPAWPILTAKLTQAELEPAVEIHKTAVIAALKAKAGRGMKGKVAEALIEELRAAGALEEKTITVARLKASGGKDVVEAEIE